MDVHSSPPLGWDRLVTAPCQLTGFAGAMTNMGYRPLYLREGDWAALSLVRGWFPGVGRITARANLYTPGGDLAFVHKALGTLASLGIPYVKVGDTMWGLSGFEPTDPWPFARTTVMRRHTFVLDLTQGEETLLRNQQVSVRTSVRKAERAGLKIREITSSTDLEAYCRLASETSARVRRVTAYTDFPRTFFAALYARLAPIGVAKCFLAWMDDTPLAGAIFLCSREQMLYFAGASTRDRTWTSLQAPTAVLWHAIREAKRLGMTRFDFGGCTPTEDAEDPHYGVYAFKKRWGGRLEVFYNLEVVLSPIPFHLQTRVLSPLWDRVHPLYFRLLNRSRVG